MRHFWYAWVLHKKWFRDPEGVPVYLLAVGHIGATVVASHRFSDFHSFRHIPTYLRGQESMRVYGSRDNVSPWGVCVVSFEVLAQIAGWPINRVYEFLGIPPEDALKEAGMTLGEWLHKHG